MSLDNRRTGDKPSRCVPKHRFWSLYGELLRLEVLEAALRAQERNDGAAGVDGQSLSSITANPDKRQQWLESLQQELKARTCRPSPVRRVMIDKAGGGQRPLGIPTVKDRVVPSMAVAEFWIFYSWVICSILSA